MKKFPLFIFLLSASCIAPCVSITDINSSNNLVIDGKTFATAYQQRSTEYTTPSFYWWGIIWMTSVFCWKEKFQWKR